jgi:hypothetical protein
LPRRRWTNVGRLPVGRHSRAVRRPHARSRARRAGAGRGQAAAVALTAPARHLGGCLLLPGVPRLRGLLGPAARQRRLGDGLLRSRWRVQLRDRGRDGGGIVQMVGVCATGDSARVAVRFARGPAPECDCARRLRGLYRQACESVPDRTRLPAGSDRMSKPSRTRRPGTASGSWGHRAGRSYPGARPGHSRRLGGDLAAALKKCGSDDEDIRVRADYCCPSVATV